MSEKVTKREQLTQRINDSLKKAETYTLRLRKTNTRLVVGGIVGSSFSVLVAGGTAIQGPMVLTGIEGWRLACILAAILSLVSTVSIGLMQQLKIGERVPEGLLCIGRLKALDLALTVEEREIDAVAKEYGEILKEYSDVIS